MDPLAAAAGLDALPPGTQLGRYEIRRLIGRGGMGSVYEALHRDLKKRVAIKTLLPSLAAKPDSKARFLREGEAASRIRHPHVVDVTDVGAEESVIYLVMEYLEGEDLGKLITRRGALGISETADIMLPVAAAIATAHEMGVIHRDLKPENIFLAQASMGGIQPKVLDFGISKVSGDIRTMALTGTGATFGTTFYLPPEQLRGAKQADARSDQYGLGTILYECVTGQRAFEGENLYSVLKDIAGSRYRQAATLRPDLPPALDAIINQAMNLEPSTRFPSVRDLGAALLDYAGPSAHMMWKVFFAAPAPKFGLASSGPIEDASQGHSAPLSDRAFAATPQPSLPPLPPSIDTPQSPRASAGGTRVLPTPPSPDVRPAAGAPIQRLESNSTFRHATGESTLSPLQPARSRLPWLVGLGVMVAVGAVFLIMRPDQTESTTTTPPVATVAPPEPKMFRVEVVTDPGTAVIELDGQPVGTGAFARRLPADGSEHEVVAHARGYRNAQVRFTDTPPPRDLALEAIAAPVAPPVAEVITRGKPDRGAHRHRHRNGGSGVASSERDRNKPAPVKPAGKSNDADGLLPNKAPIVE